MSFKPPEEMGFAVVVAIAALCKAYGVSRGDLLAAFPGEMATLESADRVIAWCEEHGT